MKEEELRELFKATNTAEPLSEGWPGLLRYGMAVAAAERKACADVCDSAADMGNATGIERDVFLWNKATNFCAARIRTRSNCKGEPLATTDDDIGEKA